MSLWINVWWLLMLEALSCCVSTGDRLVASLKWVDQETGNVRYLGKQIWACTLYNENDMQSKYLLLSRSWCKVGWKVCCDLVLKDGATFSTECQLSSFIFTWKSLMHNGSAQYTKARKGWDGRYLSRFLSSCEWMSETPQFTWNDKVFRLCTLSPFKPGRR